MSQQNNNRFQSFIGYEVRVGDFEPIGIITDCYSEDGRHWFIINDDHEVIANGCEEIVDLVRNLTYIRLDKLARGNAINA